MEKEQVAKKMRPYIDEPLSKGLKRFGRELKKPIATSNAKAIGKSIKRHGKKEGLQF